MRVNESTVLLGPRVRLVPYRRAHVLRYNQWMQDPELLELTCSEPLTLEQEFQNQRSWHADPLKLTFILCARDDDDGGAIPDDLTSGMCGDVNAFLSEIDDDDDETGVSAELEIMIAEPAQRRRGLARTALQMFIAYLLERVPRVGRLVVKVTDANVPSLRLFESLGFTVHKPMPIFQQTELRLSVASARALATESRSSVCWNIGIGLCTVKPSDSKRRSDGTLASVTLTTRRPTRGTRSSRYAMNICSAVRASPRRRCAGSAIMISSSALTPVSSSSSSISLRKALTSPHMPLVRSSGMAPPSSSSRAHRMKVSLSGSACQLRWF